MFLIIFYEGISLTLYDSDITKPLENLNLLISVWGKNIHGDTSIIGSSRMDLNELNQNYIMKKSMKLNVSQSSPNGLNLMINDTYKDPIVNIRLIYKKKKVCSI